MHTPTHRSATKAIVILVVEDDFLIRELIAMHLRDGGCDAIETASGDAAVALCRAGMHVDVLFTDIQLPGSSNGWDVADAFRAASGDLPVMYTSGNANDRSGCVPDRLFFDKPYQPDDILEACLTACV
jgi:two-component system OmpR family response regulator